MPIERVQLLKQESAANGGDAADEADYPAPINANEDYPEVRGVVIQKDSGHDNGVVVSRDALDNLTFTDPVTGTKTLAQLAASAGLSLTDFLLDCAPNAIGITYVLTYGSGKVTQELWKRTSNNATVKTIDYTYTGNKVNTETTKVYDTPGTTVVGQTTETYSYSGNTVTGSAKTRDV
jgi:hypothetical protein